MLPVVLLESLPPNIESVKVPLRKKKALPVAAPGTTGPAGETVAVPASVVTTAASTVTITPAAAPSASNVSRKRFLLIVDVLSFSLIRAPFFSTRFLFFS